MRQMSASGSRLASRRVGRCVVRVAPCAGRPATPLNPQRRSPGSPATCTRHSTSGHTGSGQAPDQRQDDHRSAEDYRLRTCGHCGSGPRSDPARTRGRARVPQRLRARGRRPGPSGPGSPGQAQRRPAMAAGRGRRRPPRASRQLIQPPREGRGGAQDASLRRMQKQPRSRAAGV